MYNVGDTVYPTEESNSRFVVTNQRNKCVFKVLNIHADSASIEVISINGTTQHKGTTVKIPFEFLTKDNPYNKKEETNKNMTFYKGQKVRYSGYSDVTFEVMDASDDMDIEIFYLDGEFYEELVDSIFCDSSELTAIGSNISKGNYSPQPLNHDYYPELEAQIAQLDKAHQQKSYTTAYDPSYDSPKQTIKKPSKTRFALDVNDEIKDTSVDEVEDYLRELKKNKNYDNRPLEYYSEEDLRRINGII